MVDHDDGVFEGVADDNREGVAIGFTLDSASMMNLVERFENEGEFENEEAADDLHLHLTAVNHYENQGDYEKVVQHMEEGFNDLLNHQQENELISEEAYDILAAQADTLVEKQP
ncbi:FIMAH domain-containing protein [Natribacillus halophilus]|uniref:FIMAH domain-containing protein n=1 Tax=Natribacillus halophilus TaxID=549003 RepID=A0A1G8MW08_9BACI|nr:hypothetical protein [Natribacillus halophilus]SDI71510.1 hypothetical protein SAMN04488123_10527 [Natribacillus halophilus]